MKLTCKKLICVFDIQASELLYSFPVRKYVISKLSFSRSSGGGRSWGSRGRSSSDSRCFSLHSRRTG